MNKGQFFALIPGEQLTQFISQCKKMVLQIAGNQQYVNDSPHLTFYVNEFTNIDALKQEVNSISTDVLEPIILQGWHTYNKDPITGKKTIVLKMSASSEALLKKMQMEIITKVQPYRTRKPLAQYSNTLGFTKAMQKSLKLYGFPFTGDIWESHFTVASVSSEQYDVVWESLKNMIPPKSTNVDTLSFNQIQEDGYEALFEWGGSDVT